MYCSIFHFPEFSIAPVPNPPTPPCPIRTINKGRRYYSSGLWLMCYFCEWRSTGFSSDAVSPAMFMTLWSFSSQWKTALISLLYIFIYRVLTGEDSGSCPFGILDVHIWWNEKLDKGTKLFLATDAAKLQEYWIMFSIQPDTSFKKLQEYWKMFWIDHDTASSPTREIENIFVTIFFYSWF